MRRTALPAKPPTANWLAIVLEVARLLSAAQARIATWHARGRRVIGELETEVQRLRSENELLRKRILRLPARHRPRYSPWERRRILWHQARQGLSLRETARGFAVQVSTLAGWLWYASERTHQGIAGLTPQEERSRRRRNATPRVLDLRAAGHWSLERSDFEGDRTLPVYRLRKVA